MQHSKIALTSFFAYKDVSYIPIKNTNPFKMHPIKCINICIFLINFIIRIASNGQYLASDSDNSILAYCIMHRLRFSDEMIAPFSNWPAKIPFTYSLQNASYKKSILLNLKMLPKNAFYKIAPYKNPSFKNSFYKNPSFKQMHPMIKIAWIL